jgi:DNA invertase Pin-like site-specific DNA recombinase
VDRYRRRVQNRPADPLASRFRQDRRNPRHEGRVVCFGDAAVQYDDVDGAPDLNVLLSFAQFEREVIGERIRDKIAASKKKGMWIGGVPPLGYRVEDCKLVVIDSEAEIVHLIFRRYLELGSIIEGGARSFWDQKRVVDERFGSLAQ